MSGSSTQSANDEKFFKWLASVGNQSVNGCKLLKTYVNSKAGKDWHECVNQVCEARHDWWPLLRGKLSATQIQDCKTRYLDRFVFICKEAAASVR